MMEEKLPIEDSVLKQIIPSIHIYSYYNLLYVNANLEILLTVEYIDVFLEFFGEHNQFLICF